MIDFHNADWDERFYISISNPFFTYLFFALGFALLGLELFAIGPGLMAFIGALLIGFSSITFTEFGLNYYGLILFFISFLIFIKVLKLLVLQLLRTQKPIGFKQVILMESLI
mgnify:CR=1 FL=1